MHIRHGDLRRSAPSSAAFLHSSIYGDRVRFAPDDGGGGSDGGDGSQHTTTNPLPAYDPASDPRVQALIETEINKKTKGLLENREALRQEKEKLQEKLAFLNGRDPKDVAELLAKLDQDEEGKLVAEGKIDEVVQRRLRSAIENHQQERGTLQRQIEDAAKERDAYRAKVLDMVANRIVTREATRVGANMSALDDIESHVAKMFEFDEDGTAVQKEGVQLFDKNGNPHTLSSYFDVLHEVRPHYFPVHEGGGAPGAKSRNVRVNTIDKARLLTGDYSIEDVASGKTRVSW